ncbi:phage head closure protein [Salipaludibacillus sp. CF4.18]|uniref:phage head closure protein n=1 Tax=Salipaludibacillus sp. CF4.18 TaxID=3373081 RepID=UPI003EE429C9
MTRWGEQVDLITTTYTENAMGDSIEAETSRTVFANKKSIRQSEFYQAAMSDLRPELMFEIRAEEYADETKLKFNYKTYDIIRAYSKNGEIAELTCQGLV